MTEYLKKNVEKNGCPYSSDNYWYCNHCGEEFSKENIFLAKRNPLTNEPECPSCGSVLFKKSGKKKHIGLIN